MSRRGENIYHRKDGRWEGRRIIGKKEEGGYRFHYVYGKTYHEVKEKLLEYKTESDSAAVKECGKCAAGRRECAKHAAGSSPCMPEQAGTETPRPSDPFPKNQPGNPGMATIRGYAVRWLSAMQCQVKESTYMKYRNLLQSYILPELGELAWQEMNRETLELFLIRLRSSGGCRQQGLSSKTVTDTLSVIRQISRYAGSYGEGMSFDPSSVTVRKEEKETQILTRSEQEILYRFLRSDPDARSLGELICLYTGIRIGEVCALKWDDISFREQAISIRRTMQRIQVIDDPDRKTRIAVTEPKSRCSVRQIPIPDELAEILLSRRKGGKGYVLTGREDTFVEPRAMERHFASVLRKAGIRQVNFHALRHTFATRCVEIGFDMKSLSVLLGHANVTITMNLYVHPTTDQKRKNMQKLSELLAVS